MLLLFAVAVGDGVLLEGLYREAGRVGVGDEALAYHAERIGHGKGLG